MNSCHTSVTNAHAIDTTIRTTRSTAYISWRPTRSVTYPNADPPMKIPISAAAPTRPSSWPDMPRSGESWISAKPMIVST